MSKRILALTPIPINKAQVSANFPKRPRDSHKGMFGSVAVIGGATGMVGAPLLAARAALKLGAGCVHVGFLADNAPGVDLLQPELMLHSAADALCPSPLPVKPPSPQSSPASGRGGEREEPFSIPAGEGANVKSNFNVLAIGCGMGTSKAAYKLLYEALKSKTPIVLDADALNLLASHADLQDDLRARKHPSVLTPHPGEAARLLACGIKEVQADRIAAVQQLAQKFACSVALKGADSLCATRDGRLFVNRTGNPGMSAAGMGDVLTGMIAAFIAQGMAADDALLLAVHLHGAAGDALAEQQASIGMTATEVTEWARWLLNQWT
ncbi:MAG: NAD(P)H-hydrate dehydratase [Gallionella sp.]|nr:NAD(P)H-hydrate dehydratase [Gallionella sp.]